MAPGVNLVVLDTGPLGLVVHPAPPAGFLDWFESLARAGLTVGVPEICDYEVRRELVRMDRQRSLDRLDALCEQSRYLPITTPVMRRASQLWADARRQGRPTAADAALDADVILAATALELMSAGEDVVVITTNERHLARYVPARTWQEYTGST